ncbi:hypothetical protein [Streptomyces clavuligerus]|nr:hypothetical protein [Streptomyces clavuligerus]
MELAERSTTIPPAMTVLANLRITLSFLFGLTKDQTMNEKEVMQGQGNATRGPSRNTEGNGYTRNPRRSGVNRETPSPHVRRDMNTPRTDNTEEQPKVIKRNRQAATEGELM